MQIFKLAFVLITTFLLAVAANATILVDDGDMINYDPNETYQFTGELSATNDVINYGFNLDPGESIDVTVTAPPEFGLWAGVTLGPEFSGGWVINVNSVSTIYAGNDFEFVIDGDFFQGQTQWLSISLVGADLGTGSSVSNDTLSALNTVYGGSLSVSGFVSSPDTNLVFGPDTGNGTGGNGGGTGTTTVPEPAPFPLMLFGIGLLGLAFLTKPKARQKKNAQQK